MSSLKNSYQNSFSLKFPSHVKPTAGSDKLKDRITFFFSFHTGPLVVAARSCGGFLAVSSLWSFCRCKGLYYTGKNQSGGRECENARCAEQHSSGIPHCLDGQSLASCLEWNKPWRGVCLNDNQFVFWQIPLFLFIFMKASLWPLDYFKDGLESPLCVLGRGVLCSCLLGAVLQAMGDSQPVWHVWQCRRLIGIRRAGATPQLTAGWMHWAGHVGLWASGLFEDVKARAACQHSVVLLSITQCWAHRCFRDQKRKVCLSVQTQAN